MIELASFAGRHALELMMVTLLVAECVAYGALTFGRARVATFHAGVVTGVVVMIAAAAGFAMVTHALLTGPALNRFDLAFARDLSVAVPREIKHVFAVLTHLGDPWWLAVCCTAGVIALLVRRNLLLACALAAASGGNGLLNMTLKQSIQRARPDYDTAFASVHSWSFPSGHTSGSLATYGAIAYVLVCSLPARWRLPVILIVVALVGVIAWSRLMIGVHYASDVLAGALSSTAWLTACVLSAEWLRRRALSR